MKHMRYAPYLVYNFCFDKVVWNLNYDNWAIGAKHFTDFIPADYATHADGGDLSRKQIITVYAPKTEATRADLLDDDEVLAEAHATGNELCGSFFPSWVDHLKEVRVFRRGHPMPMSAPGSWSTPGNWSPAASRRGARAMSRSPVRSPTMPRSSRR